MQRTDERCFGPNLSARLWFVKWSVSSGKSPRVDQTQWNSLHLLPPQRSKTINPPGSKTSQQQDDGSPLNLWQWHLVVQTVSYTRTTSHWLSAHVAPAVTNNNQRSAVFSVCVQSKALRERWLLDGAPSAGPEQDDVKRQLEQDEAKTRSLEDTINRCELTWFHPPSNQDECEHTHTHTHTQETHVHLWCHNIRQLIKTRTKIPPVSSAAGWNESCSAWRLKVWVWA